MFKRLLKLPLENHSSIFLFGPRGTGKTSWLKSHLSNELYFDLLDFSVFSSLSSNPSHLESLIPENFNNWIVIDEIQKIPVLLNEVHRLIESKKYKFILTGSSSRSLRRAGVNLLAGRALSYYMHPLIIDEIGERFSLEFVLEFGTLPSVFDHQDPKRYLQSYVQTYLKEEVLQEGLTRNIGHFTKFLEAASFSQGQVLNMTEIAREIGLNRLTIVNYFDILDDLLLSKRISVFSRKAKRKMITHEKFYFFDTGVYRTIRPSGILDTKAEAEGVALETLFLQTVRALNDYYNLEYSINFWRTSEGHEVDFILYGPHGFHAFEIKRTKVITPAMLKGLKQFSSDYPESTLHLLFLGKNIEYYDKITATPFEEMLKNLKDVLFQTK